MTLHEPGSPGDGPQTRLSELAPGKINLCLFVGPPRADGRHEVVTVLQSVSLYDEVTMSPAAGDRDHVSCPGVTGDNLAMAALRQLRERGWDAPPVHVQINKRIPIAGGMAGGSADAAAVLRMASRLAPTRPEEVAKIAASLGSDVPSQLTPGLALATGAGDVVAPLAPLAPHAVVLVRVGRGLSAAAVYRRADELAIGRDRAALTAFAERLRSREMADARLTGELMINDLQAAALSLCPGIGDALTALYAVGAEPALVTGSGPTAAGLFWGPDGLSRARAAAQALAARFPGTVAAAPVSVATRPTGLVGPFRHNRAR